ncbi:hypothetical protein LUZ60_010885 [Juncus effusus]|nr:hypothetical protein LUZ60_010885 [Juncus effusus]
MDLEGLILSVIKPSENDNANRVGAINELKGVIVSATDTRFSTISSGFSVNPYGSYVSNLYSKKSDLDISVDILGLGNQREALLVVMKALERTGIACNINFIPEARVPVLSYKSKRYNVSCDVTIDNLTAQIKSKILSKISTLDSRFQDLVLLVKEWAKMKNINDPKSGTLNSYSLCFLVIFHLQTCDPPILPPLCEIYKGNLCADLAGFGILRGVLPQAVRCKVEEICDRNIAKLKSQAYGSKNKSSLSQLLTSFIEKFSTIELHAEDYKICTHSGRWEIRKNPWRFRHHYSLFIEDPFHQSENTARAVGPTEFEKISQAFKMFEDRSIRSTLLSILALHS